MEATSPPVGDRRTAINRRRATRRRELARTIRDVRGNIGSKDTSETDYELERRHLFAETRLSAAFAVPMLALIVAAISTLWIAPPLVAVWFVSTICMHLLMVVTCKAHEKASSEQRESASWLRRFTLGDFLYGCCWSVFFLLPQARTTGEGFLVFQFATMLIVVAMNTMQSATLSRALLAGTLPVTITVTASFLTKADPIHYTLAAMAVGTQGFFLILANQLIKNANTVLEYRAEKDHLIAELETANAVSDESRRRAEAANLAKSRFLATMSHELRTPLNAILGFSEVMKDEVLGEMRNDTYKGYAADIHGSGQHLLNLINEILDLSRIEAGRYELQEEALYLRDIVDECYSMMTIRAKSKDISLRERCDPDLPPIWADERALRQVVLNLLSNAVKFTPSNGKVRLDVGTIPGGGQYLKISDTGPGIPADEIPLVMEAFGQGSVAINTAEAGTGLGLSIVQALVKMHGGTFKLDSKLREGTTVRVDLPVSRVMDYQSPVDRPAETRDFSRRSA